MTELIDTTEMYLRIILELEEERVTPMRARIAERLAHSGPTVSQTIARMERDGLVTVAEDRHLELTAEGRLLATRVMRKHRIAERLLVDILGLELEYVHDEACRWEHVISERVERKILALLDDGRESPYGNPIPGLDELGLAPGEVTASVSSLLDLAGDVDRPVTVRRIGEPAQTDPAASASLRDAGVLPGAVVQIVRQGPGVLVRGDREAYLGPRLASYVFAS
ncbi:MAG: metal-dependent transcriptional regulator [Candidatus Lutibacillus vidarii]|uniref:metal-dependent transcriptional regulator n=1 Tax=Dietzia sp. UBA5065 TaxID=1946422 RepID=UPI0025BBA6A3|nr:metal-dependent transcriptional regulator [Dietzia sp. UBA5065]MBK9725803.1 metal-dependent transcriptional regulator [Candidatus Lutibacillus vidarii]HON75790.1 metal-dependent transcriptional regulator [Dermatophilaceae bacterium]HRC00759.1 metal-dependent transcriptional regulator [Dermatophilaceae bacterium]